MGPGREEILKSSTPCPDFAEALRLAKNPALPANIDVQTIRNFTNDAKAKAREERGGPPSGIREWEVEIPVRTGGIINALVYGPLDDKGPVESPILLFFHGGGFCIGNHYDDSEANRTIAAKNGMIVVSVEYRLAPEHPFPTAVHDGLDSLQWVVANAHKIHKSASPSKGIIIGGVSAGANIANAVVYLNNEQQTPMPVTGQFLSVPPLLPGNLVPEKYRNDYISYEQNKHASTPPAAMLTLFMGKNFMPRNAYSPDIDSPLFSPFSRSTGHGNVPPTYLQACGVDVVRDDALIYERLLREECSVETRIDLYSGLPHHFWEFFPQLREAVQQRMDDTVAGIGWLLEARTKAAN